MICLNAHFHVGDNSGAKIVKCIRIPGMKRFRAKPGTIMRVSVVSADPKSSIKKGTKHLAIVSGTKLASSRANGSVIRFGKNTVILLNADKKNMVGTRVLSPIASEIRGLYPEIGSKAKEVY